MGFSELKKKLLDFGLDEIAVGSIISQYNNHNDLRKMIDYWEPISQTKKSQSGYLFKSLTEKWKFDTFSKKKSKNDTPGAHYVEPYGLFKRQMVEFFENLGGSVCRKHWNIFDISYTDIPVKIILEEIITGDIVVILANNYKIKWKEVDKSCFSFNYNSLNCSYRCNCSRALVELEPAKKENTGNNF